MADSTPDVIFMSWIPENRICDWIFFHQIWSSMQILIKNFAMFLELQLILSL